MCVCYIQLLEYVIPPAAAAAPPSPKSPLCMFAYIMVLASVFSQGRMHFVSYICIPLSVGQSVGQ